MAYSGPERRRHQAPQSHTDFIKTWIGVVAIAAVQIGTMLYSSGAQREKLAVISTDVATIKASQDRFQLETTRALENLGTRLTALERRFDRQEDRP